MNTPLHCLLLQTPGELLEGEKDFLRLGYAVEAFPSMQDAAWMMRNRKNFRCMPMLPAGAMATCRRSAPAVPL